MVAGIYARARLRPLQDPEALVITPGLRVETDLTEYGDAASLDPRLSARWKATKWLAFTVGGGRTTQAPQATDRTELDGTASDVTPEHAWSASAGAESRRGTAPCGSPRPGSTSTWST